MDGMEDILQGGRDEMRGLGGRVGFTLFASFSTGPFLVCLVVGGVCLASFLLNLPVE